MNEKLLKRIVKKETGLAMKNCQIRSVFYTRDDVYIDYLDLTELGHFNHKTEKIAFWPDQLETHRILVPEEVKQEVADNMLRRMK
ncbi:MAG: hypothetical protein SOR93_14110 [Clostridiales Family XIII bacterium]|uniref:Uncharacterized protein n=1 Tax=Hominibacterium faecale TaxID=2839743 RepID=A0A9J6QYV2_9FIRM|nr:hypothetical protein [Hominibacterium faecale]MCI7303072.1 hypothetical protein [Clostridia bacterium]MCU7380629.1 hypothetical protein [Hominibacterium faecale]MDY3012372.1 hypothetical protein [Clostridiales Family XIII bacterium]